MSDLEDTSPVTDPERAAARKRIDKRHRPSSMPTPQPAMIQLPRIRHLLPIRLSSDRSKDPGGAPVPGRTLEV